MREGSGDIASPTTRVLYLRAHQRDRQALGLLLERVRPRLLNWVAFRMGPALRAKTEPEDLAQEIMIRAAGAIESFDPGAERAFYGWLFRIAHNYIVQMERRYSAQKRCAHRERQLHSGLLAKATGPVSRVGRAEHVDRLLAAVDELPDRYREIIRLRRFEHMDNQAAARELGTTANNASVIYVRAMQALRKAMGATAAK